MVVAVFAAVTVIAGFDDMTVMSQATSIELASSHTSAKRWPPGKPYSMRVSEEVCGIQLSWEESAETVTQQGFRPIIGF